MKLLKMTAIGGLSATMIGFFLLSITAVIAGQQAYIIGILIAAFVNGLLIFEAAQTEDESPQTNDWTQKKG